MGAQQQPERQVFLLPFAPSHLTPIPGNPLQVFFAANAPMRNQPEQTGEEGEQQQQSLNRPVPPPPPFLNEQEATAVQPTAFPGNDPTSQMPMTPNGGYAPMPLPQPVTMMTMQRRFY